MPLIDADGAVLGPAPDIESAADMQHTALAELLEAETLVLLFDSHKDGRAFSWAARLLSRGFQGRLVGIGPVGLDRLAQGFRCGFDALEVSDDEVKQLKPVHLSPFPGSYQPAPLHARGAAVDGR